MKKLSIALAALVAAAFTLPAFAVDSSSPKDAKSTHKDAVQQKQQSNAGTGATSDTKTHKKAKKAKKPMKSDTNAGGGSTGTTTAGSQKTGAADNKATSGTSSPTKP